VRKGETGVPGENLSEKRTNKLDPHMTPDLEIEPGPHWWEANALTTAPSLPPKGFLVNSSKQVVNLTEHI